MLRLVSVGVVGAEDTFAVSKGGLKEGDGVGEVAGRLVGAGQVVTAGEGVTVVGAQHALAVDECCLMERNGAG